MPLGRKIGLDPSNNVLDRDTAHPSPKKGAEPPKFWPMCIAPKWVDGSFKMPPGTEVGLDPSYIVLDGDPAPLPKKGVESPIFGTYVCHGCIDQDASWYGGSP